MINHQNQPRISRINTNFKTVKFVVEAFAWQPDESLTNATDFLKIRADRIDSLKRSIEGYDKNWEVVRIYNPGQRDHYVNVLFRQKKSGLSKRRHQIAIGKSQFCR